MKRVLLFFYFLVNSTLHGQVCISNAGQDMVVCGGKKSGSNYRVYLDGTASSVVGGSINYEWTTLDDGISFSVSYTHLTLPTKRIV